MKRCVIIGGAGIASPAHIKRYLRDDDFLIYCDCGLRHAEALGREPDLIVGDFDSYENPDSGTETIVLPHEKDDTDTAYAVKEGMRRGFEEFLLIGAIGERFDHSLGNIQLLYMLDSAGKKAMIADDYSLIEVVSSEASVGEEAEYFSLLCISEKAEGITITGAKYCLSDASLDSDFPLGVSNEVLPGQTARISVKRGRLLLVRVLRADA
ncbi:MAG: thiamine diphosphokinase [Lachnospiraceae bacterium]|nr:thiamine diphosphokinase [Lachnospiraceae bacterium]MBR5732887.1 thiamine diphosphokinase [Lachnospiraceae bacterium]